MSGPVFVTGATGFLGRALVARLLAAGRAVTVLVRPGSDLHGLDGAHPATHDGTAAGLRRLLEARRPETAFHLAAAGAAGDPHEDADVDKILQANVILGAQLADACAGAGVKRFVAAGTYFTRQGGTDEYDPVSLYAAAKKAFEDILDFYARASSLEAATVCLYDLYGPDDPRPKVLNLLADSAKSGRRLDLSPGAQELDLLHVDDAVEAFLAAERALAPGPLREWCASSGRRVPLRELVGLFREATGLQPRVELGGKGYRPREVMRPWLGRPVPGWTPRISLEEGLRRVYGAAARA